MSGINIWVEIAHRYRKDVWSIEYYIVCLFVWGVTSKVQRRGFNIRYISSLFFFRVKVVDEFGSQNYFVQINRARSNNENKRLLLDNNVDLFGLSIEGVLLLFGGLLVDDGNIIA